MTRLEGPQRIMALVVGLVGLTTLGIVALGLMDSPHDDLPMPKPPRIRVAAAPLAGGPLSAVSAALADAPATYLQVRPRAGTTKPTPSNEGMPGLNQSIGQWEFQHIDVQRRMVDWVASGDRAMPLAPNVFSVTRPRLVFFRQDQVASGASGQPAGGAAGGLSGASSSPATTTQLGDKIVIEASRGLAELPTDGPARFSFEGKVVIQSADLRLQTDELLCTIERPKEDPTTSAVDSPKTQNGAGSVAATRSAAPRRIRIACGKAVHLSRRTPQLELHAASLEADLSLNELLLGPPVLVQLGPEASAPLRATAGLDGAHANARTGDEDSRHLVVESRGPLRLTLDLASSAPGADPDWSALLEEAPTQAEGGSDSPTTKQALARFRSGQMVFAGGVRVHDTDGEFELQCQDLALFFSPETQAAPDGSPDASPESPGQPQRQLTFRRAIASGSVQLRAQVESNQAGEPASTPWTLTGDRLEMMSLPGLRHQETGARQFTGRAVLTAAPGQRVRAEQPAGGSWLEARELVMADIDALEPSQWRRVAVARGEVRGLLKNPTPDEDAPKPGHRKESSLPRPDRFSLSGDTLKVVLTAKQSQEQNPDSAGPLSGRVETLVLRGSTAEPAALQAEPGGFSAHAASIAYEPDSGQGSLRSSPGVRPVLRRGDDHLSAESIDFDYQVGKLALLGSVEGVVNQTAWKQSPSAPQSSATARYRIRAARLDAEMDMAANQVRLLNAAGHLQATELTGPDVVEVDQEPQPGTQVLSLRAPAVSWDLQAGLARLARTSTQRHPTSRPRLKYGSSWIEADLILHDSGTGRASAHGNVSADLELPRRTDDDAVPETGDARRVHLEAARAVAFFAKPRGDQVAPGSVGELLRVEAHGQPADATAGNPVASLVRITALQDDGSAVGMRLLADSVEWDHVEQLAQAHGSPARAERWTPGSNERPGGDQARRTVSPSAEHLSAREIVYATRKGALKLRGDALALVRTSSLRGASTALDDGDRRQPRIPSAQALLGGPGSATNAKREPRYRISADSVDAQLEPASEEAGGPSERRAGMARLRDFTASGHVRVRELPGTKSTDSPLAVDADEARYDRDTGLLILVGDPVRVKQGGQVLETEKVTIRLGGVTGR